MENSNLISRDGEKIRAVLFDLDGTLVDRAGSLERFLGRQYDRFAIQLRGMEREIYLRAITELDCHGHFPNLEFYTQFQQKFGISSELGQALLDDFQANFPSQVIPYPGVHEMLKALSAGSLALGLVTNGSSRSQRAKIEALGIAGYFGVILVSKEQGVRKPDPEIYHRALQALVSAPSQTIFVGDNPEADIDGPAKVGLKTIWKRNGCWPAPLQADAIIDGLEEVPALIAAWGVTR